jgi:hypothetical protein
MALFTTGASMSKKLPIVDEYNPHYQYVRNWWFQHRAFRDDHPKLFARVEAVVKNPDSSEEDYRKLYLLLAGVPQSNGGRPEQYLEAFGAALHMRERGESWKVIYDWCHEAGLIDKFKIKRQSFVRSMQKKIADHQKQRRRK